MTPPEVARFMAKRALPLEMPSVLRLLEPAAGSGVLAAALIEAVMSCSLRPRIIELVMYELDPRLIPNLKKLADRMRRLGRRNDVSVRVSIRCQDFLLSSVALKRESIADVVIANPPYFKVGAKDPRALAHGYVVHGQPNIYGLFMAVCSSLLNEAGRWCFITPRSWTNGLYFSSVRRHLCKNVQFDAIHLFESRREHFVHDAILQEAMITWATARANCHGPVMLSTSSGTKDLDSANLTVHSIDKIIDEGEGSIFVLPGSEQPVWAEWTASLSDYGMRVSTGPVVAFRAAEHLREKQSKTTIPLLWMQHVKHMQVSWPINKKRECILNRASIAWMLLPDANYVLIRRFSPKEDIRRITAAPYVEGQLSRTGLLGVENHLNYICRPGGTLSVDEVRGISAFLNSTVVDSYLRTVAGSTQVNATDLRKMPFPPIEVLTRIGKRLGATSSLAEADVVVLDELHCTQSKHMAA